MQHQKKIIFRKIWHIIVKQKWVRYNVLPLITCRMWPYNLVFNHHHDQFCLSRKNERLVKINALFK